MKLLRQESLDLEEVWFGWLSLSLHEICVFDVSLVLGGYFARALALSSSCRNFLRGTIGIYLNEAGRPHQTPSLVPSFVCFMLGDRAFTSCPSLCHPWFMCHSKELHPVDSPDISSVLFRSTQI